jgi:hypothetical protein
MGDELELMDRLKLDLEFGLELELLEVTNGCGKADAELSSVELN